jgi:hypothetical protein
METIPGMRRVSIIRFHPAAIEKGTKNAGNCTATSPSVDGR